MDIPLTSLCQAFSGPTPDGRCPSIDAFLSYDWWTDRGYMGWTAETLRSCTSRTGALVYIFEAWATGTAHHGGARLPMRTVDEGVDWMEDWEASNRSPPLRVWFFFDDAGEMLGVQQDSPTPYCCGPQRHAVDRWTYGDVPEVDCSNAISLPRDAFGG